MPPITLTLTLEQTNTILEALGQMPYVRVYELIEAIGQQAGAQLHPEGTPAGARPAGPGAAATSPVVPGSPA
ncbi:hypothetical protein AB0H63_05285 [Micromonospora echinospora]|uniref:hypothetical protein n=1 Tax=Micromonospora echinospora TaxID=1877 RepID=UPI003401D686